MADVNVKYVRQLQDNVKKAIYQGNEIVGANRRKLIQKVTLLLFRQYFQK